MIVIFAGVDGTGKTTTLDRLKKTVKKSMFIKEVYPGPSNEIREVRFSVFKKLCEQKEGIVFYDRATILDDLVYEPLLNNRESIFNKRFDQIKDLLEQAIIIYFQTDIEILKKRFKSRGDDYVSIKSLTQLDEAYDKIFNQLDIKPHIINTTYITEDDSEKQILKIIKGEKMKKKKMAHILPINHLELTKDNSYHMCLAHLVLKSKQYANFYADLVKRGKFVIMDNGAAENEQLNLGELMMAYEKVRPTEMVLLDVLNNSKETIQRSKYCIKFLKEEGVQCRFMGVPQGRDLQEWSECANELIDLGVDTIGVSKFLNVYTGLNNIRFDAVAYLEKRSFDSKKQFDIHLLGCEEGVGEIKNIFESFSTVRGCDTALGFLHAKNKDDLTSDSLRPNQHINFLGDKTNEEFLIKTLNKFDEILKIKGDK